MTSTTDSTAQLRTFDLRREPWVPVLDGDESRMVGLDELFERAHEITDITISEPLERAAMRRLLENLSWYLLSRSGEDDRVWRDRLETNVGFPHDLVAGTFGEIEERLWLLHPETPFLQDPRLPGALSRIEPSVAGALLPYVPSGKAWWYGPTHPLRTEGLSLPTAARALVTRWFYALPGNEGLVVTSDGEQKSSPGAAFAEGPAVVTHCFRVRSDGLFRTMLRNLPRSSSADGSATLAWLDATGPTLPENDPLYLASLSITATWLIPSAAEGDGESVQKVAGYLRGRAPVRFEQSKVLRDIARQADVHRILIHRVKRNGTSKDKAVRFSPSESVYRNLWRFHRDSLEVISASGEVRGTPSRASLRFDTPSLRSCPEDFELLVASKGGAAMGPYYDEVRTVTLPGQLLEVDDPELEQRLFDLLQLLYDADSGIVLCLRSAVRSVLQVERPDQVVASYQARSVESLLTRLSSQLEVAMAAAAAGPLGAGELDEIRARWLNAAVDAFDEAMASLSASSRYAATIAQAREYLRRSLWKS